MIRTDKKTRAVSTSRKALQAQGVQAEKVEWAFSEVRKHLASMTPGMRKSALEGLMPFDGEMRIVFTHDGSPTCH